MSAAKVNSDEGAEGCSGSGGGGVAQAARRSKILEPVAALRRRYVSDMSLQAPFFLAQTMVHRARPFPRCGCNGCHRYRTRQVLEPPESAAMWESFATYRP